MSEKNISINLIGEEEMEHTPVGRIVNWAVTYGRYTMIGTEIVVLLAFISRFSLDRKLTDLKDEVSQKQAIIEANIDFEQQFRVVQSQLEKINSLMSVGSPSLAILDAIQAAVPTDVYLDSLDITKNNITAHAISGSPTSFSMLLSNLQATTQFQNIDIGDVRRTPAKGIDFQFSATYKK